MSSLRNNVTRESPPRKRGVDRNSRYFSFLS